MDRLKLTVLLFFTLTISGQGQCPFSINCNGYYGCAPYAVQLYCQTTGSGTAVWSTGTTTVVGLTGFIVLSYPAIHTITLSITSGTCQGTTATIQVTVVTGPENGCSTTVLGSEKIPYESKVLVFPNPVNELLNVSISSPTNTFYYYSITDNLGQCIREEEVQDKAFSISTADLTTGIYQINLKSQSGTVVKKFIKSD